MPGGDREGHHEQWRKYESKKDTDFQEIPVALEWSNDSQHGIAIVTKRIEVTNDEEVIAKAKPELNNGRCKFRSTCQGLYWTDPWSFEDESWSTWQSDTGS